MSGADETADELEEYLAGQMRDPVFPKAYEEAQARAARQQAARLAAGDAMREACLKIAALGRLLEKLERVKAARTEYARRRKARARRHRR